MGRAREILELTRIRVLIFVREPEVVFWVFAFPLIIALVLGWAFQDRGVETERVGVLAGAGSAELAERLRGGDHLEVVEFDDAGAAELAIARGKVSALVVPGSPPRVRHDPARSSTEVARLRVEVVLGGGDADALRVEAVEGEAGSRYVDWLIPGLLGMNLMGTGIWSIGFAIAEMRQKRLLRRFLVTPMRRGSLLLSFGLARLIFMAVEVAILLAFATLVLGVPVRGNLPTFVAVIGLGALAFAGLGILIASRARTIEGVSGLMNFAMMPMWLFSGVFFSYERFPEASHTAIRLLPLTALNDALRELMLDGAGLVGVLPEIGVLAAWGVVPFLVALRIFRWE